MITKVKTFEISCEDCSKTVLVYKPAGDKWADVPIPEGWVRIERNREYTFSSGGDYCPDCKDKNQ